MNNGRWRSVFSLGDDGGLPRRVITSLPSVAPPANFQIPLVERLHRAMNPPAAVSVPDYLYADPWSNPCAVPNSEPVETKPETEVTPPIITPVERDLSKEVAELLSPVRDYLDGFLIAEPPDDFDLGYVAPLSTDRPQQAEPSAEEKQLENQKATLLADLRAWSESLAQFLANHRSWRIGELRNQHAEAWRAARDQDAIVNGITAEANQATGEMRRLKAEQSKARLLVESHKATEPDYDALPSQGKIDAWKAEDARLKAARESADQAVATEHDRREHLRVRFQRESVKLAVLRKAERDIRAKLSGEVIPVLGLEGASEL